MKVFVINGSPKGKRSNTLQITNVFLEGLKKNVDVEVEFVETINSKIQHCRGCYCCWEKTPGVCVIKDDMAEIMKKFVEADLVIWSIPLFSFGMPSSAKALLDRMLPCYLPIISKRSKGKGVTHPSRYDFDNQRYVLICTCGFYSYENNTEALVKQFEIMYGDKFEKIICPEGDLFRIKQIRSRVKTYLSYARKAGEEFGKYGHILEETKDKLTKRHYDPSAFVKMADASWDVNDTNLTQDEINHIRAKNHIIKMSVICDTSDIGDKEVVLQMDFIDIKRSYQIVYTDSESRIIENEEDFEDYTLRVETNLDFWINISNQGIGNEASGNVDGLTKLKTLINWMVALKKSNKQKTIRMN